LGHSVDSLAYILYCRQYLS